MFHHQLAAILAAAALTLSANVYASETPQPSEALSPVPFAAGVEKDGKWGALDASGKVVIPFLMTRKQFPFLILKTRKLTLRARRAVTT